MDNILYHYKKFRLRNLIARQDYNTPEFRIMEFLLKERPTVAVDLGACYGVYSIFMAEHCKRVIACEPIPLSCRLLNYQLGLNNVRNAVVHQLALSNYAGTVKMVVPAVGFGLLSNYYRAEVTGNSQAKPAGKIMKVNSLPLDRLLKDKGDCSFIKIDVEGHEKEVLEGSVKTIEKYSPSLLVELNDPPVPENEETCSIRVLLENWGYTCFWQGAKGRFYRWAGRPEPLGVNYYFLKETHLEKSGRNLTEFLQV